MKKLITVVFCLLFINSGMAQVVPTFSKLFGDTGIGSGGINITSWNDTVYFSFYTQDTTGGFIQYLDFVKVSPNGLSTTWHKVKENGYTYSTHSGSLKVTSEGHLVCGGDSGPYPGVGSGTYYDINPITFDSVAIKYYQNPGKGADFFGFGELSDGNYLFSGREGDTSSYYYNAWMVQTDTSGNILWQKDLVSDLLNSASFTSPFNSGFYQYWETTNNNLESYNGADSAIFIDRYDNDGNLQWRDTFGIVGNSNLPGCFTGLRNGGGVIIINLLDTGSIQQQEGPITLYKFDSTGTVQWQRYIPYQTQLFSMTETSSGSIVTCGWGGGIPIGYSGDTLRRGAGSLIKFDKDGDLIFYQVYEYDTLGQDFFADLTVTSDGGYACIGNGFENIGGTYYQKAWLLKVDSNGCLNGNCPTLYTGIKDIPSLEEFFVFPNPASSQFTVALAGPNDIYQYHDLKFSLYDLTGRMVTEQSITAQTTVIQRGDLADGLYVWSLTDNGSQLRNGKMVFK